MVTSCILFSEDSPQRDTNKQTTTNMCLLRWDPLFFKCYPTNSHPIWASWETQTTKKFKRDQILCLNPQNYDTHLTLAQGNFQLCNLLIRKFKPEVCNLEKKTKQYLNMQISLFAGERVGELKCKPILPRKHNCAVLDHNDNKQC